MGGGIERVEPHDLAWDEALIVGQEVFGQVEAASSDGAGGGNVVGYSHGFCRVGVEIYLIVGFGEHATVVVARTTGERISIVA